MVKSVGAVNEAATVATTEFVEFLLAGEGGLAFEKRGLRLTDPRLGGKQQGPAAIGLLIQLGGVQPGEGLVLFHRIVGVHIDGIHSTGKLAADDDLVGGSEIACGGDDERNAAALHGLGDVFGCAVRIAGAVEIVPHSNTGEGEYR
jgi:hypothetical protein